MYIGFSAVVVENDTDGVSAVVGSLADDGELKVAGA
jgi:hypothetical protein